MELIVNIIKFNTAYIDREIIVGIVQRVCNDVCIQFVNDNETFLQCLFVIETVICYTVFPNEILAPCIIVLCRAVNSQAYLEPSYKIMRSLLGTQLGYASLLTMTNMLNESRYYVDGHVLRGAVFHINMNLWGGNNSLLQNGFKYSSTVLSSYLKVLQSGYIIVMLEVIISIQTLLKKCGKDLSEPSWDFVLEILESIRSSIDRDNIADNTDMNVRFHDVINTIEGLILENKLNADVDKVYELIERISSKRPVSVDVCKCSTGSSYIISFTGSVSVEIDQLQGVSNISVRIALVEATDSAHGTFLPSGNKPEHTTGND